MIIILTIIIFIEKIITRAEELRGRVKSKEKRKNFKVLCFCGAVGN